MRLRSIVVSAVVGILLGLPFSAGVLHAQPASLNVDGLELLPQSIAEEGALFVYNLSNGTRRVGFGLAQIDHGNVLPTVPGECVDVLGGSFAFLVHWMLVAGEIVGGEVCLTDDPNIYAVSLEMITEDGLELCFEGRLNHAPLNRRPPRPPTFRGVLSVCEEEEPAPE